MQTQKEPDANTLHLDPDIPRARRAAWIREALENPYCFRAGDLEVTLEFSEDAPSLQDALCGFFERKKGAR